VGHVAAASRKSPPVFCGRRGILTACFVFQISAPREGATPWLLFWSADEKEELQTAQAQAVRAARIADRSRKASRECAKKESRTRVNAVASDSLRRHLRMARVRMFPEVFTCFATADVSRKTWTCTYRKTIYEGARSFRLGVFMGTRHPNGFLL
jgi:hypothetical protein